MLPYMGHIGMCRPVKGMVFKQFTLAYRVYKSERLGLEEAIIFHETEQLVEDFIETKETRNCFSKI